VSVAVAKTVSFKAVAESVSVVDGDWYVDGHWDWSWDVVLLGVNDDRRLLPLDWQRKWQRQWNGQNSLLRLHVLHEERSTHETLQKDLLLKLVCFRHRQEDGREHETGKSETEDLAAVHL